MSNPIAMYWVVIHAKNVDDETRSPLFWSNEDGWGTLSTATIFCTKERKLNLPMEGRWIPLRAAILKLEGALWEAVNV